MNDLYYHYQIDLKTKEKYLHENIIADSGGIDDFLKYNHLSILESKIDNSGRKIYSNNMISSHNSFAERISTKKFVMSKNINNQNVSNNSIDQNNKSFDVKLFIYYNNINVNN